MARLEEKAALQLEATTSRLTMMTTSTVRRQKFENLKSFFSLFLCTKRSIPYIKKIFCVNFVSTLSKTSY